MLKEVEKRMDILQLLIICLIIVYGLCYWGCWLSTRKYQKEMKELLEEIKEEKYDG